MPDKIEFQIREGRADDAERIAEMIYKLEEFEGMADEADVEPERIREHLFGSSPFAQALVAESAADESAGEANVRILGCAIFHFSYAPWKSNPRMFLQVLYVEDEARSAGVGEALLTRVTQLASDAGCCGVDWNVIEWNERAIKFYESKFRAKPSNGWTLYAMEKADIAHVLESSNE